MKKSLLALLLLVALGLNAQTPMFYNIPLSGVPGNGNSIPFSWNAAGARGQFLFPVGAFAASPIAPTGGKQITKFYFVPQSGVLNPNITYASFQVFMGQPNLTSLTTAWETNLTKVIDKVNYVINPQIGVWLPFQLDIPFNYDPTKPLLVDVICAPQTPYAAWYMGFDNTTTADHWQNYATPHTAGSATARAYRYYFGFDLAAPPYTTKFTQAPIANIAYDVQTDTIPVNSPYTFVNTSHMDSLQYWDIQQIITPRSCVPVVGCYMSSSVYPANKNFTYTFTQTGIYTVRLVVRNPLGTDSVTKQIYVGVPTGKPAASFFAEAHVVGQQQEISLYDYSYFGPTAWQWRINPTSISGVDTNRFLPSNQVFRPKLLATDIGKFDVCLKVTNSVGADSVCKPNYIEVVPAHNMCTDNVGVAPNGFLYSNAGPYNSYNPATFNNSCSFLIDPCAITATATIEKLKLRNKDSIVLRDGGPTGNIIGTFGGSVMPSNTTVNATSGKIHVQWKLNDNLAITAGDTGFVLRWSATGASYAPPSARFNSIDTVYAGQTISFTNQSFAPGTPIYSWDTNADGVFGDATAVNASTVFDDTTIAFKNVCLQVTNCKGVDVFCKTVMVLPIVISPQAQFFISMNKGFNTDMFQLNDISRNGILNRTWTITPNAITYLQGTNANSPNPVFRPNLQGKYSVKLVVSNAYGTDSLTIPDFFEVLAYSSPNTELPIAEAYDLGITNVRFADINEFTALKTPIYHRIFDTKTANVFRGVTYPISVARTSANQPMDRKVWIDFNLDGDFLDAGELVINEYNQKTITANGSFTIPPTIEPGRVIRLRVGVSDGATTLTPDKATSGCFEDYAMLIATDFMPPSITLNGNPIYRVELNKPFVEPGITAIDNLEGDISQRMQVLSNLNTAQLGTYTLRYFVLDYYGNSSDTLTRVVQVEINQTGPVITLNGPDTITLEVFTPYTEAGATAVSNLGADISAKLIKLGSVNTNQIGSYTINYSVVDNFGFTAEKNRIVIIKDTQHPVITSKYGPADGNGVFIIRHQINTPFSDANMVVTDNYFAPNQLTLTRTGSVNDKLADAYNLSYIACDPQNNCSQRVYAIVFVEDTIAPTVQLLGQNPLVVDVFEPYNDPKVIATDNYYATNSLITLSYDSVNINLPGNYAITYVVRDGAGNQTTLKRNVIVADRKAPVIELLGSNPLAMQRWKDFNDPGIKIIDNLDSELSLIQQLIITSNLDKRNDTLFANTEGWRWVRYQVKDAAGNLSEIVERTVKVGPNTGLNNMAIGNVATLYPNPSHGNFTIELKQATNQMVTLQLFDAKGALVFTKTATPDADNQIKFNNTNLAKGMYLLRFNVNNLFVNAKMSVE